MQHIKFYFAPYDEYEWNMYEDDNVNAVIEILYRITKILSGHWSYIGGYFVTEENTGQRQPVMEFQIETDNQILSKMASFVKLLEYDNTVTFKTMFNELFEHHHWDKYYISKISMTRVGDNYISDLGSWSRYLTQATTFDESSSIHALGGGVLYVMMDGVPKTFCNENVCTVLDLFHESKFYNLHGYTVGICTNSNCLSHGMSFELFLHFLSERDRTLPISDGI